MEFLLISTTEAFSLVLMNRENMWLVTSSQLFLPSLKLAAIESDKN